MKQQGKTKYALGHALSTLRNCPEDEHWPLTISREEHEKLLEEAHAQFTRTNLQRLRFVRCRCEKDFLVRDLLLASLRCQRCSGVMKDVTPAKYRRLFHRSRP